MTKAADQAFFDATVTHLMQQTHAAVDGANLFGDSVCVYYDPTTGNRCAVGAQLQLETAIALSRQKFIGELGGSWADVHRKAYEGNTVAEQAVHELRNVSFELIERLQLIHDKTGLRKRTDDDKIELLIMLKACAVKHGLVWS